MKVLVGGLMALVVWLAADRGEKASPASAPAGAPGAPEARRWGTDGPRRGSGRPFEARRERRWGPGERRPGGDVGHEESAPSPREVEEFMTFAREHFPEMHERLAKVRATDPAAFRSALRRVGPPLERLVRMWREDPELARRMIAVQKAEMGILRLMEQYRRAGSDQQRAELREQMRRLLEERFDLRLDRLRGEIADLRRRLEEQSRRLSEQEARKRELLDEEFGDLLRRLDRPASADLEHHE